MHEYGIFTDEGLLEGDFYSEQEAEAARLERYPEDDATVHRCCEEHRDQPAHHCDDCLEDEE